MSKKNVVNSSIVILFFIITFVFLLNSPLNIWSIDTSGIDSSVFRTIALMITKGYIPYTDTFDHKGPYIYLLNWVGQYISYDRGVWFIEFINLFATICAVYKISRLKCNKLYSVITTLISISLLFGYFQQGNFTEEYALPLIAVSLYIFLDYLINKKIRKTRLIICGVCLGLVLLLRANMIATWIVFCIVILIKCLKEKEYKNLIFFIKYFILGIVIVVIPIIIWLSANGVLTSFWEVYIKFNKHYSSYILENCSFMKSRINSFIYFTKNAIVIFSLLILCVCCYTKKEKIYVIYTFYIVLTLLSICMSGRIYAHYGIILVPAVTFPFAALYDEIDHFNLKDTKTKIIRLVITLYLIVIIIIPNWMPLIIDIPQIYNERNIDKTSSSIREICEIIKSNTDENDKISVYGNWDIIYVMSKRMHATKYSYQFPIVEVLPNIHEEYIKELQQELPEIIVVNKNNKNNKIEEFLLKNNYCLILDNIEAYVYKK